RLRLPGRRPGRAPVPRPPHHADLRGHERDPAPAHRAQPRRMTPAARLTRQGRVHIWVGQLIQRLVLCGAGLLFLQMSGPLASTDAGPEWRRYAIYAVLLAGGPALLYLRTFQGLLDADLAAERGRGIPDPELRGRLSHSLRIGGLPCGRPSACGAVQVC